MDVGQVWVKGSQDGESREGQEVVGFDDAESVGGGEVIELNQEVMSVRFGPAHYSLVCKYIRYMYVGVEELGMR